MNLPNGHYLQNGKYQLTQVIGQGGFGITYKGIWFTEVKGNLGTVRTEVPVCIKEYFFKDYCDREPDGKTVFVHSETGKLFFDKFKEKLIKEATILSEVHHPHIVNVLEVFEENNTAYIAMEYISGYSLKQLLDKEGVLPENTALNYVAQIGSALSFVHQNHILHLDIKPSNIIIDKNNNARLIDFGVSKRYNLEQQETSTTTLTLSKGFASIEQYDNEGTQTFSPCPDIYALGATMYNLLTGKIPTESILRVAKPLPDPLELNRLISKKTAEVILKAMEIKSSDRYQSIEDMMSALDIDLAEKENRPRSSAYAENDSRQTASPQRNGQEKESEESTILYIPEKSRSKRKHPSRRKTQKKKKVLLVLALLLIIGAFGFVFLRNNDSSSEQNAILATNIQPDVSTPTIDADSDSLPNKENEINPYSEPETKLSEIQNLIPDKVDTEKRLPQTEGVKVRPENVNQTAILSPSTNDSKNKYDSLISSGKRKMNEKNYIGAKTDFSMAVKEAQSTEEVVQLLIDIETKMEEEQIVKRKAQYEQKLSFGPYIIVRKIQNDRYGAIDNKGNEIIPCKYLYVGRTKNGRAFEREDHLYDIYDSEGKLISGKQTYY